MSSNKYAFWIVLATVALIVATAVIIIGVKLQPKTAVFIGSNTFQVDVAKDERARQKGLSGRHSLTQDQGMLLVFENDAQWAIWMKDMRFAIDVAWIDKSKKIVHIEENINPGTFPQRFAPNVPVRYVLELSAGAVEAKAIKVGDTVSFDVSR